MRSAQFYESRRGQALAWRLTVAPLDEKDVSCRTGPVGERSKRESAHEPAAHSRGPWRS
jgi:hypothetical protein